jgi:hypothetical protein
VVQSGVKWFTTFNPLPAMTATAERVRFTISVEPEVHEAFADLAFAGGVSLSRCIGDWLRDTAEAAQITTIKLNEIRKTPQEAFAAFIRDGLMPEVARFQAGEAMRKARSTGGLSPGGADAVSSRHLTPGNVAPKKTIGAPSPPSSNTGGKVPRKGGNRGTQ